MKKIVFLTPTDSRRGFSLAGIAQVHLSPTDLETKLQEVIADPEVGLVAIDERLLAGWPEEFLPKFEKRWPGVLVVIPAPEQAKPGEDDYALKLIRQAIGYHVRLKG